MPIPLPVYSSLAAALVTNWFLEQIPKPGEPLSEVEKKLRTIAITFITSVGIGYLVSEIGKKAETQAEKSAKRITLPGYYE